jgi:alpha-tubulin suppressor-like RCC1 family protein
MTGRAQSAKMAGGEVASDRNRGAIPRPSVRRRLWALLATSLLACLLSSGSASARIADALPAAGGVAPKVTEQPVNVTVEEGQNAVFESMATGTPEPTVRWETSSDGGSTWRRLVETHSDRLTITDAKTSENGYEYRAVFENEVTGQKKPVVSQAATLTVTRFPTVAKQPLSVTVNEGQGAVFEAMGSGFPTPTVQWEVSSNGGSSWSAIPGATADLLSIASTKTSENGDEFRAAFTNAAGTIRTAAATLIVHQPPKVTEQPSGITVEMGKSASFEAAASGFPAPTVQWEVSTNAGSTWSTVAGATTDQLTIASTQLAENGDQYRAVFTNAAGKATSEAVTLTVAAHHYRVVGWGQNEFGQLGDGNFNQSDTPVPTSGLNFVTAVAAGRRHSLALLSNGTVVAWGQGGAGQLGDGEQATSDVPVAVQGLTGVTAIAAGTNDSLALLSNGTVMAWGGNESGQLGDGSTVESAVPVAVKGLTGVTAIAAGGEHCLALLSDGKVMAWGANEDGQLGTGDLSNHNVPVAVKALTGVAAIAAGGEYSLALLGEGTVMAWGADEYGQLGNSAVETRGGGEEGEEEVRFSDVPVAVNGLSEVSAIVAGVRHSLALLKGGTVMAWGADEFGQLGDGSIVRSEEAPVAVSGLAGVAAISAGGEHSMALLGNGTVMTWGEDKYGELGDGLAGEPSDVPVTVGALREAKSIAAGGSHDLALSEPIPTVTAISPTVGAGEGGTTVRITGTNLEAVTAVHFGANSATRFTIDSPTSITAVSPAGVLGTVDVTVTVPAGTSPTGPADRFSYVPPPTVKKLSAKKGPGAGGTTVTITGTRFEGVTAVHFGASEALEYTVNSPTSITAVSPPEAGTVNVTVTGPGGSSAAVKGDQFEFIPTIEGIAPNSGPASGGTSVIVTGAGFAVGVGTTTFKFKSKLATEVNCTSQTSCNIVTPEGKAGTIEVTAAVGKLKSAASSPGDRFTYE